MSKVALRQAVVLCKHHASQQHTIPAFPPPLPTLHFPPSSLVDNPESCTIFLDLSLDNPPKGFGWVITAAGRGGGEKKKEAKTQAPPSAVPIQDCHIAYRRPSPRAATGTFTYLCDRQLGCHTAEEPSFVHPDARLWLHNNPTRHVLC